MVGAATTKSSEPPAGAEALALKSDGTVLWFNLYTNMMVDGLSNILAIAESYAFNQGGDIFEIESATPGVFTGLKGVYIQTITNLVAIVSEQGAYPLALQSDGTVYFLGTSESCATHLFPL
jgi:hypothetical protein